MEGVWTPLPPVTYLMFSKMAKPLPRSYETITSTQFDSAGVAINVESALKSHDADYTMLINFSTSQLDNTFFASTNF